VPAINPDGVKIAITGISPTNQTISHTNFNDSTFNNLPIGTYDYVIEYGSAACTKTGQVTIDRSGTVGVPTATNVVSPACFGEATGALTLDVPGETGNVLQWSFDGGITDPWKDFTAGNQVTGIPAGPAPTFERVISVRRNASDPCFSSVIVAVPETAVAITANLVPTNASCNNIDGSIAVTGLPAGSLTFRLNGNPITLPANGVMANLSANTYVLRVTTATGCFRDFNAVVSFPGFVPTATPVVSPPDCTGGGLNGSISFSITTPGSYTIGYTQDPIVVPNSFFNPGGLNVVIPNLSSGFWYVWVRTTGVFCETKLGPFNLAGTVPVDFQVAATDEICFGSNGAVQLTGIRGAQNLPFNFELIKDGVALPTGAITFAQSVSPFTIPNLAPGTYRIQLTQNQSSLLAACTAPIASSPRTFTITGPARALDTLYVQREISLPDQATGSMRIGIQESSFEPYEVRVELITPVFPAQNFLMDWRAAARNPQTLRMELVVNNLFAGVYKVSLRDARGCEKEYNVEVKVDTNLFVPNIFTPNGDGFNDTFFIRNLPAEANLEITNRWGKSVFQAAAYQNDWDANGISEGLYFYRLSFGGQAVTGWVEILRGN
jgi:gliding motility-associated-like protein